VVDDSVTKLEDVPAADAFSVDDVIAVSPLGEVNLMSEARL